MTDTFLCQTSQYKGFKNDKNVTLWHESYQLKFQIKINIISAQWICASQWNIVSLFFWNWLSRFYFSGHPDQILSLWHRFNRRRCQPNFGGTRLLELPYHLLPHYMGTNTCNNIWQGLSFVFHLSQISTRDSSLIFPRKTLSSDLTGEITWHLEHAVQRLHVQLRAASLLHVQLRATIRHVTVPWWVTC